MNAVQTNFELEEDCLSKLPRDLLDSIELVLLIALHEGQTIDLSMASLIDEAKCYVHMPDTVRQTLKLSTLKGLISDNLCRRHIVADISGDNPSEHGYTGKQACDMLFDTSSGYLWVWTGTDWQQVVTAA